MWKKYKFHAITGTAVMAGKAFAPTSTLRRQPTRPAVVASEATRSRHRMPPHLTKKPFGDEITGRVARCWSYKLLTPPMLLTIFRWIDVVAAAVSRTCSSEWEKYNHRPPRLKYINGRHSNKRRKITSAGLSGGTPGPLGRGRWSGSVYRHGKDG